MYVIHIIPVFSDEPWRCLAPNENYLNSAHRKVAYQNTNQANAYKAVMDWSPLEIFNADLSIYYVPYCT